MSTGRWERTAALFLATIGLCAVLSVTAFGESRSAPASVNFTSERPTVPVPPVDPDRPGTGTELPPDRSGSAPPADTGQPGTGTVTVSEGERIPVSASSPTLQMPGATGAAGWLAINYVTPLHYGTEIVDGVYTVQHDRPYLQTSDLRGTATGWKVTAIAGPFYDPETMSPAPALLSFCHGSPNSANVSFRPPDIPDRIEIPANGRTQRLVEFAHENEGVGIWVARWYPAHGAALDFQLQLFSPVSSGRLGFVLWVMNDAP